MKKFVLAASALLLMSMMAAAQTEDRVCEVSRVTPKPGTEKQLEAGRKAHNAFHTAQKDPYSIMVWSVLTGNATGSYLMTTCNMKWSSLDRAGDFDAKDTADIARTFGQYAASSTTSYYVERTDMNRKPDDPNAKPPKMISIITFFLKGDGATPFIAAVKRIAEAQNKSNYPGKPARWYQLANGGEGPQFVLVGDRASWADMQGPEKTLQAMLEEVYGKDDNTLQNLRAQIRYTQTELAELRPDLSYMAAK